MRNTAEVLLILLIIIINIIYVEISHWFSAKENDWGYASFLPWKVLRPTYYVHVHVHVCV